MYAISQVMVKDGKPVLPFDFKDMHIVEELGTAPAPAGHALAQVCNVRKMVYLYA